MSTAIAFAPSAALRLPAPHLSGIGWPARLPLGRLAAGWLPYGRLPYDRSTERLVVLAPLFLLPLAGTLGDVLRLSLALFLLLAADAAALALASTRAGPVRRGDAALATAVLWILALPVLGAGAVAALALFLLVRSVEVRAGALALPWRFGLAALGTALVVDLALVTLAVERGAAWLALGGAIGAAWAAARALDATDDHGLPRPLRELLLVAALVLVLACYGALLAREPGLADAAATGGLLTVPLLAAAVLRLAVLALEAERRPGADPVAVLLLAGWALAAAALFGQA